MKKPGLAAVKLSTADIRASETFFRTVFGFEATHRYGGGAGDPFEEVVMTYRGGEGMQLKFIQFVGQPAAVTGEATIQIVVDDVDAAVAAAKAEGATDLMPATDYPEAQVRMAVIATDQGHAVEVVQTI